MNLFKTLSGIWWILVTGSQWNQLPERFGKWNSVYRFHLRWAKRGVFEKLVRKTAQRRTKDCFRIIDGSHIKVHQDACYGLRSRKNQAFGKTKGGRNSKLNAVTNKKGKLVNLKLVAGNESELKSAGEVLDNVEGCLVLADKGFDSDKLRNEIRDRGGVACIPKKSNSSRYVFYLKELGAMRYVVENYFSRIKRFRRVGTRYDRLAETYLSFVFLASLMDWLKI